MAEVTLVPTRFSLVRFDAERLGGLLDDLADRVGLPATATVRVEVDEVLPAPLAVTLADVVDGRGEVWCTGGALEDTTHAGHLDEGKAAAELGAALLRVRDRLGPGSFAAAPGDLALTDTQRAAWDVWTDGRLERLGVPVRRGRRRYLFRLACGFSDTVDETFARLWAAERLTWDALAGMVGALPEPAAGATRSRPGAGMGPPRPSYAALVPEPVAARHPT